MKPSLPEIRYRWEIEYVPDDPRIEQPENLDFTGTEAEARRFAEQQHPDYCLRALVFHRCGPFPLIPHP